MRAVADYSCEPRHGNMRVCSDLAIGMLLDEDKPFALMQRCGLIEEKASPVYQQHEAP